MDRRPTDDAVGPRGSVTRELRVDTDGEWPGMPSPRRVATAPSSPSTAFQTDREAIFRSGNKTTVAETHLMRSSGSQSESFTEEHWSSEITSFVTAAPPKFLQVIKAYRVLSSDTPTLVVEVVSDPPAIFEWFCNDRPVQQDRRRFQARHGLNITTLTVHQPEQGVYKCTARNPAGVSTSYGYITVNFEHQNEEWTVVERSMAKEEGQSTITIHRAPRFINQVPNLTIQPGSLAVIDVEVDADPPARFSWFVNGVEYRESCKDVEITYPSPNRCVAKFSLPVCGEYKAVASNVHGSAMSSGYIEIYRAKPTRTMRPPVAPGEHLARNIMTASHHTGNTAPTGEKMVTTHEVVNVYEINYTQRSSSVPRGVRHLESHVEVPHTSQRRISLEQHRSEHGSTDVKLPERLPRSLFKTRSEGAARYLPHAPKFVTTLPPQVAMNPNENLVLSVNVDAIPTAEFRWDVNGFEVKPSKKVTILNEQNRSTLMVQPPVKLGKYSVTAFNDQGRETLLTRVVHVVTETTEKVQVTTTATETNSIQPDIVESAVTVTSANEADWEVVDSVGSDPSTTSIKTVRKKEQTATTAPKVEKIELSVPIVTNVKIQQTQKEEPKVTVKIKEVKDIVTQQTQQETVVTRKYTKKTKQAPENIPKRPVLLSEPSQNVHLSAGEKLVLESRVDSHPPATFRWYVNNFEAKNGQYVTIVQPEENVSVATFQRPTPGMYKVVASNPHGEVTSITKVTTEHVVEELHEQTTVTTTAKPTIYSLSKKPVVTVRDDLPKPPRFVEKLPVSLKVGSEQPIKFKAAVDAVPEATFMWLLNNFELKRNQNVTINRIAENVSELSLQKVQPGKYDVVAKNHMGQDSCSCKVIVEYEQPAQPPPPPPRFTRTLCEETYFQEDEETRLEVAVSGSPPFSFVWSADGTELKSTQDTQITVDENRSTLILPKGHVKSGTVIAVEVSDRYGKNRSQTIMKETIKEESKTTITVEKKPVDVVVKEETVKKEVIKEEYVKHQPVRRPSQPASEAPRFVHELENINIYEGDTLRATVRLTDEGAASNFGWFANGLLLIPSQQVRIQSTTHQSTLTIENIGEMSNVELCVMARNQFGTASSVATLNVGRRPDESFEMVPPDLPEECAPKIVEPLHSASFIDGQPMVLRCRIEAIPSAAIVWSKDDVNVEEWVINKDVVTQILPGGICELLNPEVYPEDSGLYKCTATNPHGTAETAAYINIEGGIALNKPKGSAQTSALGVTYRKDREEASASETMSGVADEPTVVVMPPKFVEQLNAETDGAYELNYVRLLCRIRSSVPTTISWWKDGVELLPSKKYEFHRFSDGALILTVYEPQPSDNGIYTCKAESEHGVSSSSCEVTVPTRTTVTETVTETSTTEETSTVAESSTLQVIETSKEDYVATTEITKHEEEYKLLVKVADSVASTLVANVFVDAVREAVKRIMEEESEEEEIVVVDAPRFETSIERYVVQENETVTISTVVTGTPTPFIEWYFKDQKLHVTEQISMGYENKVATLILKNVTKAQEGTYYCHATNIHGTTVLPSEVKVVPEKASDTIRLTLAKYDKREESEHLVTNIFAHRKEEEFEQVMKMHVPEKANESARLQATPRKPVETAALPTEEAIPVPIQMVEESPVPPPRKHPPREREEVPVVVEIPVGALSKEEEEQKTHLTYTKFAETFASNVMSQAQTALLTSESTIKLKTTPAASDQSPEVERVALQVEGEADKVGEVEEQVEAATYMTVTQPKGNIVVNSTISLKEQINEEATTIDVRRPFTQFNHAVTVVEPEVVQLGLRLPAPSVPTMKFIDLETILQRPGTSSSANTLITSPSKGSANAEHRIVVLEGASQNFQNAMTLSLKKVQRLATEAAEPSSFAQVEILRPNEANEAVVKIVDVEKIIPDLLRVAAAASKLKLENVTVSLVKQPDTAHHELVIEYESHVEDTAEFNLSQIVYDHPQEERKEEVWSRRSRFSEVDENVVAVFVEVDANCPDQSVEILATVNAPVEEKIDSKRPFSPDVAEVSESITESSLATGQQPPRFFRELKDCSTVVGKTVQFKCIVSGMPTPEVKWYVDGDVIQQSREYDIVYEDGVCILRINEALAEDEGEYSCEATNSVGRAETKCFLRVNGSNRPQRFIEHVPSVVELVDDSADSFDSFEWEERKANSLFPSNEGSLKRSSVTYNSEFDLSKVVNYNENMEETNAFYKYFDTAQTSVKIWEIEQYERVLASFHAATVEEVDTSPTFSIPPSAGSASCEIPSFSLEAEHLEISAPPAPAEPLNPFDDLKELLPYIDNGAPAASEEELINELREPREPDLPQKMSYKGHEIAVSVNEVEKEEIILNEKGDVEISKKTCLEASFEFDTELDIAQSIKKIYKALPEPLPEEELMTGILSNPEGENISEIGTTGRTDPVIAQLELAKDNTELDSERVRAQSVRPKPRLLADARKSASEGFNSKAFDPQFINKMKEIERIARQVDAELGQISGPPVPALTEDAKEIEEAIFKISDQLLLAQPITEAQAEANEELLRTTLADMILNPTRTAEEEMELMRRPIRLLRRKLSDFENSLMEDVEVMTINEDARSASVTKTSAMEESSTAPSRSTIKTRVPSAEYLRVTPLTSNIKDQLSCLEEMIVHMSNESMDVGAKPETSSGVVKGGNQKKRELHDLLVQINNEMNTIKSYCKTKLSKKGTDAVVSVLQKVKTHVGIIVNVVSLSKKKHPHAIEKSAASTSVDYEFVQPSASEKVDALMFFKKSSLESSVAQRSSTALSTSDDTWRYSTELKNSTEKPQEISRSHEPEIEEKPEDEAEEVEAAPKPPPRRRRTQSADPEVAEIAAGPPVRPPRKAKNDLKKRDHSLDSRLQLSKGNASKKSDAQSGATTQGRMPSPPSKPKRSFAGDTFDFLRNLNCTRSQKNTDDLEKSLLVELSQMPVSEQDDGEVLSEPEWVQSEVNASLKSAAERAKLEHSAAGSLHEESEKYDDLVEQKQEENVPNECATAVTFEANTSTNFEAAVVSAACAQHYEATADIEVPLLSLASMSGNLLPDDGRNSVQLICEESDYATDTDTSALLRGTVQFFNRNSPLDVLQSSTSISLSQRSSRALPDLPESDLEGCPEVNVTVELHNVTSANEESTTQLTHTTTRSGNAPSEEIHQASKYGPVIAPESISDETETIHLVLEETLLSQMASSVKTDDTDRITPLLRGALRETDILSDDSVVTEIDRSVIDNVEQSFNFSRSEAKKRLLAIVYQDVRQCARATIALDNTFDVEIFQEPENLSLIIKVIEDQVNFTSLTVMECNLDGKESPYYFDEITETSSYDDNDGESRTGITVSIIARSLHDGIYASLEEIPWGEVEMTLPESMAKSIDEDSKMSVQFNVTVSESNPEERKSLRSQISLTHSQNSISEIDNTVSTGSINIPSYVIKLGSTATITCELNNYLPPNSKIDWYKGNTQIEKCPGKLDRISHDLLEVLIINDVQMEDNELYSLKVNEDIFPVAYLIVEGPSTDELTATILTPPQTQFVMEGQPTVLMCQVSDPNHAVEWLKDRKPLEESSRLQFDIVEDGWNRVVFSQTRMSDQGTYFAVLGQHSVAITLVVEGVFS
ncbi:hypothetical protein Y032_0298g1745 [Ancylostoma ceylanicum]|uniref:Ig-like domain-containing protein n=1 Tax=Ancylostoma ceylanicum TaxID=53326 RepID=A0A016S435_9BILA|nr:hypothetical protein Y032_0298g1745 [Ancylostoma ceylanicum]